MIVPLTRFQSVYGEEVNSQDSEYIITYLMRKFGRPEVEQNASSPVRRKDTLFRGQ